jgi:hypothetical protein
MYYNEMGSFSKNIYNKYIYVSLYEIKLFKTFIIN